ncbi:MAG TPA: patatin-like phospholipase family protein [Pyrinomonadaceae bacterium]|nr:patatin-like phospholipase family protein [Pyrinomonadaceae bacterium]
MPSSPPKIGLALSGGAVRGMAHVGVLRALKENGIPIDCIAGTSAGSIVGGAYAAGMPIDKIAELGCQLRWRHIGRMTMSPLGFQTNKRLESYMRDRLPVTRFEDLPIPFAAVATDLRTNSAVVLKDQGDVPFAIRASCTIPGWYVPVVDDQGRQLVDGGLVAVVPAVVTRSLGADIVIAVDVNTEGPPFIGSTNWLLGVLVQSLVVVAKTASSYQLQMSDIVISPKLGHVRYHKMGRAAEVIEAGYEAGLQSIAKIRELIDLAGEKKPQREEMLA